jgi:proteasome lid subunit RPN8/RPN11
VLLLFSATLTIADHVRANPHREAGGLLFGCNRTIVIGEPSANIASDQLTEFALDPEQMAKAIRRQEGIGYELIGTFHSHPNGSAEMSRADVALARSTGLLLICATGPTWHWALYDPEAGREIAATIAFPYTHEPSVPHET